MMYLCAQPWASTPRSTFLADEIHLLATGPRIKRNPKGWIGQMMRRPRSPWRRCKTDQRRPPAGGLRPGQWCTIGEIRGPGHGGSRAVHVCGPWRHRPRTDEHAESAYVRQDVGQRSAKQWAGNGMVAASLRPRSWLRSGAGCAELTSQACTRRWGMLCAQSAVPHSCEQRSGRSHPPTTAPQHYARSAQSHDRSIVRLLNRGSCSGRALLAAARSSCFRVNPPPPLSPPVCSWRGEYVCSMYGVPSIP